MSAVLVDADTDGKQSSRLSSNVPLRFKVLQDMYPDSIREILIFSEKEVPWADLAHNAAFIAVEILSHGEFSTAKSYM